MSSQDGKYGVVPVTKAPLQPGASSERQSALLYRQDEVAKQNNMNKSLSGGKRRKSRKARKSRKSRKSRKHRGGKWFITAVVPSFSSPGPVVSPVIMLLVNSMQTNTTLTQSGANGACDKCIGDASNTPICQGPACNPQHQKGGSGCSSCTSNGNNGLIPNGQTWGCMSGGKRRKSKKV